MIYPFVNRSVAPAGAFITSAERFLEIRLKKSPAPFGAGLAFETSCQLAEMAIEVEVGSRSTNRGDQVDTNQFDLAGELTGIGGNVGGTTGERNVQLRLAADGEPKSKMSCATPGTASK